jgi:Zn-dependent protease
MQIAIGSWVMWVGMAALILSGFVAIWPARRMRQFTLTATIAAPAEHIWKAYAGNADDPAASPLSELVAVKRIQEQPPIHEHVLDASGGHRSHLSTARYLTLQRRENEYDEASVIAIDGKPYPYGDKHTETFSLHPAGDRTAVEMTWRGETATLGQFHQIRRAHRNHLRRLQAFCEQGKVLPAQPKQTLQSSLLMSALAIGTFVLWLGWLAGLILTIVLIVHEFGHWVAMRLTGQPAPRMMLVPFFGGIALANHPHRSMFSDAFCALMGAGLSALVSLALVVGARAIFTRYFGDVGTEAVQVTPLQMMAVNWTFLLAFMVGSLNLLQLIPVLPLDGGQVLRAVMQSFHAGWARRVMLGISGLGVVGFAWVGEPLLAGVIAFGGLQAWHMSGEPPRARPMRGIEIAVIVVGYALAVAIHGAAAITGLSWMRPDGFSPP